MRHVLPANCTANRQMRRSMPGRRYPPLRQPGRPVARGGQTDKGGEPAYVQHIYGATELGCTSVLYLSRHAAREARLHTAGQRGAIPGAEPSRIRRDPDGSFGGWVIVSRLVLDHPRRREVMLAEGKLKADAATRKGDNHVEPGQKSYALACHHSSDFCLGLSLLSAVLQGLASGDELE